MKKNILFYVLALFLTLVSFELTAQKYIEVNDIRYRVIKEADESSTYGTVSVAKPEFGEYEDDIDIPNVIKESEDEYADAYKVVGIDDEAFYLAKYLGAVKLPVSLETIGENAFRYSSLSSITIPMGNLTAISDGAFGSTELTSVDIPSSVKSIGEQAFQNCPNLESVSFSEGLESIGNGAFSNSKITTLVLPESVKSIGNEAFSGCELLNKVTLGKNLKAIGDFAFEFCCRLRHIDLPKGLKGIGENAFAYSGIIEIIIPESVKEIKKCCFLGSFIRTIHLHDKIRSIDQSAFNYCHMDTLIIPVSAKINFNNGNIIYGMGFYEIINEEQRKTTDDEFNRLEFSERNMLLDNVNSTKTTFGANREQSVREKYVSNNNSKLTKKSIKYSELELIQPWRERIQYKIDGVLYSPIQYPHGKENYGLLLVKNGTDAKGDVIIPDIIEITDGPYEEKYIVTQIRAAAFDKCTEINNVTLPSTIESIGISAFRNSGLTSFTFPRSLTTIPSGLFLGCKNLTSITIPNTITKIESYAFESSGLTSISIPSSIDTIEDHAFESCKNLSSVELPSSLLVLGERCFCECPLTKITLPESLVSIGCSCFERCQLTEITIPKKVELIDKWAFNCESLTLVNILGDPSKIKTGSRWFVGDPSIIDVRPSNFFGNNKDLKINTIP